MTLLFALFTLLLVIVSLIGFLILIVGTPTGLVLVAIHLINGEKTKIKNFNRWVIVCFSGIPILMAVFILWTILQLISAFLGIDTHFVPNEQL